MKTQTIYTLHNALDVLDSPIPDNAASDNDNGNWSETENLKDAANLARNGDSELLSKLEATARNISTMNDNVLAAVLDSAYDVSGHTVDVEKFLAGDPECMLETTITTSSRIINILVNANASCTIQPADLTRRLAITASIIRALEIAGYSVGLTFQFGSTSGQDTHEIQVQLKTPDCYADWSVIAFWLSHPSALRRCAFRLAEAEPWNIRKEFGYYLGAGYGTIADLPPDNSDTVYIPCIKLYDRGKTDSQLMSQIAGYFKEQNVLVDW